MADQFMQRAAADHSHEHVPTSELEQWMEIAWRVASGGVAHGEYPFGAAICRPTGQVVAAASNTVASTKNAAAHAEVNAIKIAGQELESSDLSGHWLVSTAEPCPMCMAAAVTAGIDRVAFGVPQAIITQAGYGHLGVTGQELASDFAPDIAIRGEVLRERCASLLLDHPMSSH